MGLARCVAAVLLVSGPAPDPPTASSPAGACAHAASSIAHLTSLQLNPATTTADPHFCVPPGSPVTTFSGRGSMKAFRDAATPDTVLQHALARTGWVSCTDCSADGPDGAVWAAAKDGVVVVVEGRWDGGDDTEPDAPTSDVYEIIVRCFESARCERAQAEPESPAAAPRTGVLGIPSPAAGPR